MHFTTGMTHTMHHHPSSLTQKSWFMELVLTLAATVPRGQTEAPRMLRCGDRDDPPVPSVCALWAGFRLQSSSPITQESPKCVEMPKRKYACTGRESCHRPETVSLAGIITIRSTPQKFEYKQVDPNEIPSLRLLSFDLTMPHNSLPEEERGRPSTPNGNRGPTNDRDKENRGPSGAGITLGRRPRSGSRDDDPLSWGPRKRPTRTDPLVSCGRHFGRTIHAFCRPFTLLKEGLTRYIQMEAGLLSISDLTSQEMREHRVFQELLRLSPGLDERVLQSSPNELHYIADMVNKGASGARADDTKSLKAVLIDWITPVGGALVPPLSRNRKSDRGFFHFRTGELLCPPTLDWSDDALRTQLRSGEIIVSGEQWPAFLYLEHKVDLGRPWEGLLQGPLLVSAFKHVFTCPSSVDEEIRATRSGNAELHGMTEVTRASLAYIATMVIVLSVDGPSTKPLTSFIYPSRSILDFLEDPEEQLEVEALLKWWNMKIFPSHHAPADKGRILPSVKDALKEWRANRPNPLGGRSTNN
ncbi:hypothetical protein NMY22_g15272 [Coprinellus aureogranulatus]|nr:hypothetical protein NMY22_g15272 [Coprinellus aureogranulatus]